MEGINTAVFEIEEEHNDRNFTLLIQNSEDISLKAVDFIVDRTLKEESHVEDIVNKLNDFPKIKAEIINPEYRKLETERVEQPDWDQFRTEKSEEEQETQEEPEESEEDKKSKEELFSKIHSFNDESVIDEDAFDVPTRREKVKEILGTYEPALTITEITRLIYQLPESVDADFGSKHRNRIQSVVYDLQEEGVVQVSEEERVEVKYGSNTYELAEEPDLQEPAEDEEPEEVDQEQVEENRINKLRTEADMNQSDFDILVNAFDTLAEEHDVVRFQDFEKHYAGSERPLKMFRKLFSNTELLKEIISQVSDSDVKWKKISEGSASNGLKKWVILLNEN